MVIPLNGKIKKKGIFRVSVYLNEADLTSMADQAHRLKFRRGGIPLKTQKPHGFADEWVANTDGVGLYLKFCHDYYVQYEGERLNKLADIVRRKQQLEKEEEEQKRVTGST